MEDDLVARASIAVDAPPERVWKALVDPDAIRQFMFGTNVETDWQKGSPIVWRGEWEGRAYEDKGTILAMEPQRRLKYSHFSPLAGKPDRPENYHTITIDLAPEKNGTRVALAQDNNADAKERDHSAKNWQMMLGGLKKYVEGVDR